MQQNNITIFSTENVEDREYLEISITDSGTGISQDKLKKLLKMDNIPSEDGTGNEKGTGLGLLICKQYLNKIGGILVISSTLNEGTEIKIFLPYNGEVI
ncbi:MAG TPA: ATP-binding protein [Ignavibacteriales bacterium]|nr:ATP-binding protein [Ignavibacteriales bacterium]HOL80402.1 ATP-binding protein [Ignavibacteriales bacterium]HOM64853.1 ATP-binding protein [Ignavibacteriales bacterium]HPD67414.1 ATP-binding protein [Ignavibacteriales bacterium]HPP32591.1 ATP-binding protein [Ignavibacteriales bacterium]